MPAKRHRTPGKGYPYRTRVQRVTRHARTALALVALGLAVLGYGAVAITLAVVVLVTRR